MQDTSSSTHEVRVGARLCQYTSQTGVRYGTIRYVGPVTNTKGMWLGVEWDLDGKGKHNGTHHGYQYFTCSREGNVASFIRPPSDTNKGVNVGGVKFLDALQERYTHQYDFGSGSGSGYSRRNLADIEIEMPNMDKVSSRVKQLQKLRTVALTGPIEYPQDDVVHERPESEIMEELRWIVGRSRSTDIGEVIPLVTYLDLSRTLISSWKTIADIASGMEYLDSLHLHYTRLDPLTMDESMRESKGLQHLLEVGLDKTRTSWYDAMRLLEYLPRCRVVHLADNYIASLDGGLSVKAESLKEVNLEGNCIHGWEDVLHSLSVLPSLEKLHLSRNQISSIPDSPRQLSTLSHLGISNNPLWNDENTRYTSLYTLSTQLPLLTSLNALPPSGHEPKTWSMNLIAPTTYSTQTKWYYHHTDAKKRCGIVVRVPYP